MRSTHTIGISRYKQISWYKQITYFLAIRPDLIIINKENRTCRIVDFAVSHNYGENFLKSEKKHKYLDLAKEMNRLWNMKVTIILILIGALGTLTIGLVQGLDDLEITGRVKTNTTAALLRSARILRRVLEIWGDLFSLKLQWKSIS